MTASTRIIRPPAETLYAQELAALAANDSAQKPLNWKLSPKATHQFIIGSNGQPLQHEWQGQHAQTVITQKFYGDNVLVERCIVTLLGQRALMLVGEPGTAKSLLSELLAAAITGNSTLTIQGSAGTTDDQIKYSWNYALLLAEGPSPRALVPSPVFTAMHSGGIVRFEEITRCQPEIQDTLVSLLSDKAMQIPELSEPNRVLFAAHGFNLIATANLRDRGVHEMSSALKRRFNFETIMPLANKHLELQLVREQTEALLHESNLSIECPIDVLNLLVTTFQDLRHGRTEEGMMVEKPTAIMSTAEAVAVSQAAALDAAYFGNAKLECHHIARQLLGTVLKDNPDDADKLRQYFASIVKTRGKTHPLWQTFYNARNHIPPS